MFIFLLILPFDVKLMYYKVFNTKETALKELENEPIRLTDFRLEEVIDIPHGTITVPFKREIVYAYDIYK